MRRLGILFIICAMLLCGGCQGSIYSNYRDVERLQPVQTLGIDAQNGSVCVAVAAGEGQGEGIPAVLRQSAESVETALVQLQNAFPEAQPYYAHVQYILFGSQAAEQGMGQWLEWIERSPKMRLDALAFIVRGEAGDLILSAATQGGGTAEKLESLDFELRTLGEGMAVSVRSLASALAQEGTGLCGAIQCADESGSIRFDDSASIQPAGFAVFRDGALCAFIEQQDAPAVLLLLGQPQGARIPLGGGVTMRLGSGRTRVSFNGATAHIACEVEAVIVEAADMTDVDALGERLGAQLAEQIERVMALEASLGCDFLGLLDGRSPEAFAMDVSVDVHAEHSYGLRPQEGGQTR